MEKAMERTVEKNMDTAMERTVERNMENMDCMDRNINRMGKLDCLNLERIDGTPGLRSRSNSINQVQSDSHREDEVRLVLL